MLGGREGMRWEGPTGGRGAVLQYELCHTVAGFRGEEKILPCCNDTVKFVGNILKCISLEESRDSRDQHI